MQTAALIAGLVVMLAALFGLSTWNDRVFERRKKLTPEVEELWRQQSKLYAEWQLAKHKAVALTKEEISGRFPGTRRGRLMGWLKANRDQHVISALWTLVSVGTGFLLAWIFLD